MTFTQACKIFKIVIISIYICGLTILTSWYFYGYRNTCTRNSLKCDNRKENGSYLTIHCNNGRLGNQMSTVAVLYGLARLNHRKAVLQPCHAENMINIFDIKLPVIHIRPNDALKKHDISYTLQERDSHISNEVKIITGNAYPESYTFFNIDRREVQKQFKFKHQLVDFAHSILSKIRKDKDTIFVGVHVRRGDYPGHLQKLNKREASVGFFQKAFQYFRDIFPKVVFVMTSDDVDWCRTNLADKDVYLQETRVAGEYDLALLSHCNHSIMTYGTFGFWSAYLAGGRTVYLSNSTAPGSWYDLAYPENKTFPPDWIGISEIKPDYWKTFKIV